LLGISRDFSLAWGCDRARVPPSNNAGLAPLPTSNEFSRSSPAPVCGRRLVGRMGGNCHGPQVVLRQMADRQTRRPDRQRRGRSPRRRGQNRAGKRLHGSEGIWARKVRRASTRFGGADDARVSTRTVFAQGPLCLLKGAGLSACLIRKTARQGPSAEGPRQIRSEWGAAGRNALGEGQGTSSAFSIPIFRRLDEQAVGPRRASSKVIRIQPLTFRSNRTRRVRAGQDGSMTSNSLLSKTRAVEVGQRSTAVGGARGRESGAPRLRRGDICKRAG